MSPREQATAVKLLQRWLTVAKASKRMPLSDEERLKMVARFVELLDETDRFIEHEDPPR